MEEATDQPRWARWAPGVHVLAHYDRSWLRGDVVAGVTVAAYLVPQVMAYAEIAGLPAVTGLWAILLPLLIYAALGSSRQLSVGPESTTALMTAAGVGALVGVAGGAERWADVAALMAIAVGLVCLLGAVLRLGFLANLLSRPVLVGYMAGIAVLMITSQLGKVTKTDVTGDSPVAELRSLFSQLDQAHVPTLVLSASVLVLLLLVTWVKPRFPGPLVVMVLAAIVVAVFGLERHGIVLIGEVPRGLPTPEVPSLRDVDLWALVPYAIGIAVVAASDNVLTGRAFASARRERIDAGQELFALGAVNVANGFVQGFPVSSSGSRTVIGDAVGSRTQVHSLVAMLLVVASLLVLGPALSTFPAAALGALVVYAALRLIDVAEIRRIGHFRRSELILAALTTTCVIVFGVLSGIGLAIALSLLDLIRRIAHPHDGVLGHVPGLAGMHDVDDYPDATLVPGLMVYRYDSPLFFANSEDFLARAMASVEAMDPPCEWFVLNAEANTEVDLTAVDTLDQLRQTLTDRGIIVALARAKTELVDQLRAAGFVDRLGEDRIYPTLPTAVAAHAAWYQARHGHPPTSTPLLRNGNGNGSRAGNGATATRRNHDATP
ncbi:SulP family inorganic anion transporter [Aestuariimicrobium ganziense]|uniref:SulP family inorganic anion transporter n=1 Tax=Aestuariimicrobium ganziense TaxID=2773677 RepID=UPI0019417B7B|nr:sulfate permease [Aestuariimicrobium ganziense]